MDTSPIRDIVTDAIRYWEPRRIFYNALLAAIVIGYFAANWPASKNTLSFNGFLGIFILAVLANMAYCTAYIVDIFGQFSMFQEQRGRWRVAVLTIGFTSAAIITRFFALSMFQTHS